MICQTTQQTLVVIGNGMAGARAVEEILARDPRRYEIRMFGAEPYGTYNRILLSGVLGGLQQPDDIVIHPLSWYDDHGITLRAGVKAERIDRDRRVVVGGAGRVEEPYDRLIIATGSRPFVPPITGIDQPGVWVFRTLDDCRSIMEQARQAARAVVLGGGLLGLEAARGLLAHGVEVTVVEMAPHLMVQQLDPPGAAILQRAMEAMGVRVLVQAVTRAILGAGRVTGVELQDGTVLPADLVVVSCGIRPNVELARQCGLAVERAIVVDDQLRTTDPDIFAVGECAQHRGRVYGLVDPVYEQARVLAEVLTRPGSPASYEGSQLATTLKVMGVDLTSMGDAHLAQPGGEVLTYADPAAGLYKKLVIRDGRLSGAILLGANGSTLGLLTRLFRRGDPVPPRPADLLFGPEDDAAGAAEDSIRALDDAAQICNCNAVSKAEIVAAIRTGQSTVDQVGAATKAGTGCGSCQVLLRQLIAAYGPEAGAAASPEPPKLTKVEIIKREKDGLDVLPDIDRYAAAGRWEDIPDDDKDRLKWYGLFFRKQTPGHFMMRLRAAGGQHTADQFRVIAEVSDRYGKGFCDLTTRQQVQLRWFTIRDVPEIWAALAEVGLHSKQTGMDNVRGVCGCPAGGLTPQELFDATPVAQRFTDRLVGNKAYTNLPRKFNVTITGCLENCCHAETQDVGLVPAVREVDAAAVPGFNILVGGKQGSGGFRPATPLDVFVTPEEADLACELITLIFRDHGSRQTRTRARLAFLVEERGAAWLRAELGRRWGRTLPRAGVDQRKKAHTDHIGVFRQKQRGLNYVGLHVPVGRISTDQLRGVAALADRYGSGAIRLTVGQNLIIPNIPDRVLTAMLDEPLLKELSYNPSPVMRGLVSCTGIDYCHFALIETKGWAIEVARALEKKLDGQTIAPLTIHWSGCSAGCGQHQVSTIGLQGCRSRIQGRVVDAAHVYVNGRTGPQTQVGAELMHDVPCDQLANALVPLVRFAPRK